MRDCEYVQLEVTLDEAVCATKFQSDIFAIVSDVCHICTHSEQLQGQTPGTLACVPQPNMGQRRSSTASHSPSGRAAIATVAVSSL